MKLKYRIWKNTIQIEVHIYHAYSIRPNQSRAVWAWSWSFIEDGMCIDFLDCLLLKGSLFAGSLALINYPDEVKIVDRHQSISLSFPSWCYLKKLNHIRANKFTQVWNTANAQHHNFKTQCMKQPSAIHLYGRTMLYVQTPVNGSLRIRWPMASSKGRRPGTERGTWMTWRYLVGAVAVCFALDVFLQEHDENREKNNRNFWIHIGHRVLCAMWHLPFFICSINSYSCSHAVIWWFDVVCMMWNMFSQYLAKCVCVCGQSVKT